MRPLSHLAATFATSLALLCHGFAMASGAASAALSNIQLAVLDLTPDDGIAAGYDIEGIGTYGQAYLTYPTGSLYRDMYQPATVRVEQGHSFAEAHAGNVFGEIATRAAAHPNIGAAGMVDAMSSQTVGLRLRPHTAVMLSGHYRTVAEQASDEDQAYAAESDLLVRLDSDGISSELRLSHRTFPGGPAGGELEDDFLLMHGNGRDHDSLLFLYFDTRSMISPAPVPEPATLGMLGAGLALVGGMAARRRRERDGA